MAWVKHKILCLIIFSHKTFREEPKKQGWLRRRWWILVILLMTGVGEVARTIIVAHNHSQLDRVSNTPCLTNGPPPHLDGSIKTLEGLHDKNELGLIKRTKTNADFQEQARQEYRQALGILYGQNYHPDTDKSKQKIYDAIKPTT